MRGASIALMLLVGCGPRPPAEEPQEPMPSSTLDKQDPTAHYEHYERKGGGWFSGWHLPSFGGGGSSPDPFWGPSAGPPHYYTGCGGCSSDGAANGLVLLAVVPLVLRRRRR